MAELVQERRQGERVVLSPPLQCSLHGCEVSLVDLGIAGARVRHRAPLAVNGPAKLTFAWDGEEIALDCNVVRSDLQPALEATPEKIFETGVQFIQPEHGNA